MGDGTQKRIDKLKKGDEILSFNINSVKNELSIIEEIESEEHEDLVNIIADDIKITCTVDHPFLSDKGWVSCYPNFTKGYYENIDKVEKLDKGSKIYTSEGTLKTVDSIIYHLKKTPTYQIQKLSKNDMYYANTLATKVEPELNK